MRKKILLLSSLLFMMDASEILGAEHPVMATVESVMVQLTQSPDGGTNIRLSAEGLEPSEEYAAFYYASDDCLAPIGVLGVTTNPGGVGVVHGKIDDDLVGVRSISLQAGPDYGTMLACMRVP